MRGRFEISDLEAREAALAGQVNAGAAAIDELIALNSRDPLDQADYQLRFNALVEQHAQLLADQKTVADEITDRETRRRAYEHYQQQLAELEKNSEIEYSPFRWHTLLEHAEVESDGTIDYVFLDQTIATVAAQTIVTWGQPPRRQKQVHRALCLYRQAGDPSFRAEDLVSSSLNARWFGRMLRLCLRRRLRPLRVVTAYRVQVPLAASQIS